MLQLEKKILQAPEKQKRGKYSKFAVQQEINIAFAFS